MTLQEAAHHIKAMDTAMAEAFKRPVFDEYAIVARVGKKVYLAWYDGPRREAFIKSFAKETAPLKEEARSKFFAHYDIGDFEFTHEGTGSKSEAFVVVGKGLVLICGNTTLSMVEIAKDPLWLGAQAHFASLSDRFRAHPLLLSAPPEGPELTPP